MPRNPPIRRLGAFAAAAVAIAPVVLGSTTPAPGDLPSVDFQKMGAVGFGGAFAGLDWFSAQSPFAALATNNDTRATFSSTADTLVLRNEDGTFAPVGGTDNGGHISAMCWVDGTLFIGGSFTSFGSTPAQNIVSYSPSEAKFSALGAGISGTVETLHCDGTNHEVWAGGFFSAPESQGNVGRWSTQSSSWETVPFGGLNGRVHSISSSTNGDSLYFGGEFSTLYADSSNSTIRSLVSIPIAPPNTITTGNSGYLVPVAIPAAASQYGGLSVSASPATEQSEYNDADSIVCPNKGAWLARDGSVATVNILGHAYLAGSGIRVSNSLVDGRGTKTFTVTSLPDNTVLKLTYTDPTTGETKTCDNECPLSTDAQVSAQDFLFADGSRTLTGFHIVLDSWQGDGAALGYVQLLSNGAYASAVQSDNEGTCGASNSTVNTVGNWENATSPSNISGTEQGYMSATVPVDNPTDTSVTLHPWVGSSGFYDIYLVIPGCNQIGDCSSRTTVDIAVFPTEHGLPYTMTVDQRVTEDTEILIYSGLVDASSPTFSATIRVALPNDPAQVDSSNYVVVAAGVQMQLTGLSTETQTGPTPSTDSAPSTEAGSPSQGPGSVSPSGSSGSSPEGTPSGTTPSGTDSSTPGTIVDGTTTTTRGGSRPSTSPSPTTTTRTSSSPRPTPTPIGVRAAYGVYEWVRSSQSVNATGSLLPNRTETALTRLGFALDAANNQTASKDFKIASILANGDQIYVAGSFQSGTFSNVVAVGNAGSPTPLASQGLNGAVTAAANVGSYVYFGGDFTGTAAGGDQLNHLARYDTAQKQWTSVDGGVDGPVSDIVPFKDGVLVVGNFSNVLAANGSSTSTGGYAVYNTTTSQWATGGMLYGNPSAAASTDTDAYLGGRILGSSRNAVNGVASLSVKDGTASISGLEGVSFSNVGSAPAPANANKRSHPARWIARIHRSLIDKQLAPRADPVPIPDEPAVAPASLAGAYWTNSSASNARVTILGGNFTQGSGANLISGVAFQSGSSVTGPSPPVSGVVRALEVHGNDLYVGGTGVNVTGVGNSILKYDLSENSWVTNGIPTLFTSGSDPIHVNAIKARTKTDTIMVAGNFDRAGDLPCPAVCQWDAGKNQWSKPGGALSGGEVRALDYADAQSGILVAGGSFILDSKNVYAATYSFANNSWTQLGDLPGPVQSLVVNDKNMSNIFAAGYEGSTSKPYLHHWDGSSWTPESTSALMDGTAIQNLAFVPLSKRHEAQGPIQDDRMLMASGNVFLSNKGNVSSALYDGQQWHPYLVGSSPTGAIGAGSSLFWSESNFSFSLRKYLDRGLVVLVAMAIATGLILLIVLLILLVAFCLRRQDRRRQPAQDMYEKDDNRSEASSTHNLIHSHVQTALEQSFAPPQQHHGGMAGMAGLGAGAAGAAAGAGVMRSGDSGESEYVDAEYQQQPLEHEEYAAAGSWEGSDEGRDTVMRYDFCGPELQSGELAMKAGQRVIILDDEQSEEWWYARDPATGRQGVVPATYGELLVQGGGKADKQCCDDTPDTSFGS